MYVAKNGMRNVRVCGRWGWGQHMKRLACIDNFMVPLYKAVEVLCC